MISAVVVAGVHGKREIRTIWPNLLWSTHLRSGSTPHLPTTVHMTHNASLRPPHVLRQKKIVS